MEVARQSDRLGAAGDLELAKYAGGMALDHADGDQQRSRDFGVGRAARDQVQQCSPLAAADLPLLAGGKHECCAVIRAMRVCSAIGWGVFGMLW